MLLDDFDPCLPRKLCLRCKTSPTGLRFFTGLFTSLTSPFLLLPHLFPTFASPGNTAWPSHPLRQSAPMTQPNTQATNQNDSLGYDTDKRAESQQDFNRFIKGH
uniref:Uncharacterized protein n=1 Tax=Micrurus spixii TaxID=129469 RepID=A0A2D4LTH7_9SAUR